MAILNAVTVEPITNARNRPFNGFAQERPRAKVWANWCIIIGGEPVQLPLGQAIDTMEPASVTGQNVAVVKANHAKNKVLSAMQAIGAKMAPGETMIIGDQGSEGNVVCLLRRVSEDLTIEREAGELDVGGIVTLLAPKKPVEAPVAPVAQPDKAELQAQLELIQKQLSE